MADVPLATPQDLADLDGLVLGFSTRYGMMAAQAKAFLDHTGSLWSVQKLAGKPAGTSHQYGDTSTEATRYRSFPPSRP